MNIAIGMLKRIRRKDFYGKLVTSYIAGLTVVLLIVSLVCINLIETISDFSDQTAVNATTQFQATVENMARSVEELQTELSLDSTVISLMATRSPEFNSYQRHSIISLVSRLKSYRLLNPYIKGIFLYFPKQDYLISDQGVYSLELWSRLYTDKQEVLQILSEESSVVWRTLDGDGKLGGNTMMRSKLVYNGALTENSLCVLMDPVMDSFNGAQGTDENSSFYTLGSNGDVLFTNSTTDAEEIQGLISEYEGQEEGFNRGNDYITYMKGSSLYPFSYMYFLPSSIFFQTLSTSRRIVVISFSGVFFIGILLSILLARRTSRPIQRIAHLVRWNGKPVNTLTEIEESIVKLVQIKEKASNEAQRHLAIQKEGLILKLIHREISDEGALHTYMEQNGIEILGNSFVVVIVHPIQDLPLKVVFRQLGPLIRERLPDGIDLYFIQGVDEIKIAAAIRDDSLKLSVLKAGFQEISRAVSDRFQYQLRIAISEIHPDLFQLGRAYEEAQRIDEYSAFVGIGSVLAYGELVDIRGGNENSLIFEMWFNKFANLLANHSFQEAQTIQKDIFEELKNRQYSLAFIKCKIFSFIDHTINIIGELDIAYTDRIWDDLRPSDRLLACSTLVELEDAYYRIFTQLSQIVQDTAPKQSALDRIYSIIHENYTNPDFNVSFVAERLGSSTAYVSRIFKDSASCNMLDYIQKLRIDDSKKLLKQAEDMTIGQIAEQCGFSSNITFTRVFKKYEGISPGKYRDQKGS